METRRGVLAVGACLVGVVSGGLALPAARAATETLTQGQFNNKYEVVYNGTPQECDKSFYQNIQGGTCKPYVTLPFVALKDLAAADNVYYRLQRFDIARVKSTADFLATTTTTPATG
ncbi:MAG: hypothetical protein U0002_09270 [Thermoanaerobaculia bacterium]